MNEDIKEVATLVALSNVKLSPAYPTFKVNKSGGWISYGDRNDFPQHIIDISSKSPANNSIIQSKVTYILGKGINDSKATATTYIGRPNDTDTWDEITERIAVDYVSFGGLYCQVIVNKDGTTVSIFHEDFSKVRVGQINERGEPITFRISNDWSKTSGKNKPIEIDVWPGLTSAELGKAYLFHYWDYSPGLMLYSVPQWWSAEQYVKADGILGQFYNNSIDNGFTPSVVISMPNNPEEPKKAEFQQKMERAFSGAKGASSIVVLWGEGKEVKPEITPFNASANADIYNNVEGIIFQKIISAHRLSSPTLAGIAGNGNLSGNSKEIISSYILFNYTVIEKMRRKILDQLNIFTKINGTAPLQILELDVISKIKEATTNSLTIGNADEGNADEGNAQVSDSLAQKIGVGGTQALTAILADPNMPEDQKRGLLKTLFGLGDDEVANIFNDPVESKFKRMLKKLKIWN